MANRPHWLPEIVSTDHALRLRRVGLDMDEVTSLITLAITEDLDGGVDVTSVSTVPADQQSTMELTARKPGIVSGAIVAAAVFDLVSRHEAQVDVVVPDGVAVNAGDVIVRATGSTLSLLTAERTALNFLCHLSGIATATQEWVREIEGTGAKVRDTRKTTPGMRKMEKYAVTCGGGENHRMSLSDAALIKDNHIVAAGGVVEAFAAVRRKFPEVAVEVEVDSMTQLHEVVEAGADLVLLDNFTVEQVREAVEWNAGRAKLEASGGITLDKARAYAETGVDYIAVGALTHSAPILDIGADLYDAVTPAREEQGE
jgi:nicotinate-nucleotide pyrophosphorylase (carboxylating)